MFYFNLQANSASIWEKIAEWYPSSLINEVLSFFKERYFTVTFPGYENISLGANANESAEMLVVAFMIAMILAAGVSAFSRTRLSKFVRIFLRESVHTPEEGRTLMELGAFRDTTIRRELSRGVNLRRVIRCREEEEHLRLQAERRAAHEEANRDNPNAPAFEEEPFRMDFLTAHFYIPEELRYRADVRYTLRGTGWIPFLLTAVAIVVLSSLACFFLPDILQLIDNIISMTKPS